MCVQASFCIVLTIKIKTKFITGLMYSFLPPTSLKITGCNILAQPFLYVFTRPVCFSPGLCSTYYHPTVWLPVWKWILQSLNEQHHVPMQISFSWAWPLIQKWEHIASKRVEVSLVNQPVSACANLKSRALDRWLNRKVIFYPCDLMYIFRELGLSALIVGHGKWK